MEQEDRQTCQNGLNPNPTDSGRARILLIEDDEDDVVLVSGVLGSPTFELTWCMTAAHAREQLHREPFDLILLDHGLPDTNALAFLEELKQTYSETPVMVLTGRDDRALALSAVKKGAVDYILKDEIDRHLVPAVFKALGLVAEPLLFMPDVTEVEPPPFAHTAERLYLSLLETMNEGCLVVDTTGIVTFTNRAIGEMLGLDSNRLLGRMALRLFDEPTNGRLEIQLSRASSTSSPRSFSFEGNLLRLDNLEIPILVSGRTMHDDQGLYEATLLVISEITELVESRAKLLAANEQLKEQDRMKSHFLSMVSHDLRTPISAMSMAADFLIEGLLGENNPEQLDLLRVIQRNVNRLYRMVINLLDLSQIEAGELILDWRTADLKRLTLEQIEDIHFLAERFQVQILTELPDDPVITFVDADRFAQVLMNLLSNALRFASQKVSVRLKDLGHHFRFEVQDDGPGIPTADLKRIFERFACVSAHKEKSKTGLGLSIVEGIVSSHGGSVYAENVTTNSSDDPQGARFVVILPRRTGEHL